MTVRFILLISLTTLLFVFSTNCRNSSYRSAGKHHLVDLEEIRENGKLVVTSDFNSTDYFIYRGQPMGFQYEMLQDLAEYLGIKLEVRVSNNLEDNFNCLMQGDCNLIALNLTITKERRKMVDFTEPHSQTRQILVQRKPDDWEQMTPAEIDDLLIRNPLDLAGKIVYIQQNSAYTSRLKNLSDEIGDTIFVVEVPQEAEQLITMVAEGEIDYTICDENVALVNQTYYPNIDVSTPVSFQQNIAWAVQKGADELKDEINKWLKLYKESTRYKVIYDKYFRNSRAADIIKSDYFTLSSGKISAYDDAIRKYSLELGWDWRLVSSMIYQESGFNPKALSWAGAYGLMQLMPTTSRRFGVNRSSAPEQQIRAGVEVLKWLDARFRDQIPDQEERIKFILGAYNAGYGHVMDAMNLSEKYGKDPRKWDNAAEYLLKKANPSFYRDPVVRYGYCRGIETYNYVVEILDRYEHYKNLIGPGNQFSLAAQ